MFIFYKTIIDPEGRFVNYIFITLFAVRFTVQVSSTKKLPRPKLPSAPALLRRSDTGLHRQKSSADSPTLSADISLSQIDSVLLEVILHIVLVAQVQGVCSLNGFQRPLTDIPAVMRALKVDLAYTLVGVVQSAL